ncbi:MAG: class II fructose-bisphosphate aldolase [Alphaproteobacteria bacterium]
MTSIPAGVVTGEDYINLVKACKKGGYALPAVNVVDSTTASAALEAAREAKSDIIIQVSNGGAHFFGGAGLDGSLENKIQGAKAFAQYMHTVAKSYGICVALHTDHANRGLIPWLYGLIDESKEFIKQTGKPLFSSHMLDLSEDDLEFNLSESEKMLKEMAPLGMSLEIELGCTGGEEDGIGSDIDTSADNAHLYTQPEDVLEAYDRLNSIGHFSIAASFGNVHGVYKPGNVKLRPEILKNSQTLATAERGLADNELDFVFHGGSGSEKSKIEEAVSYGCFKMNIDTDTQFANSERVGKYVDENPVAFKHQICPETGTPQKKHYDPRKWMRAGQQGIVDRLGEAFKDLGSYGKSVAG